jgi:hypothetical protein
MEWSLYLVIGNRTIPSLCLLSLIISFGKGNFINISKLHLDDTITLRKLSGSIKLGCTQPKIERKREEENITIYRITANYSTQQNLLLQEQPQPCHPKVVPHPLLQEQPQPHMVMVPCLGTWRTSRNRRTTSGSSSTSPTPIAALSPSPSTWWSTTVSSNHSQTSFALHLETLQCGVGFVWLAWIAYMLRKRPSNTSRDPTTYER